MKELLKILDESNYVAVVGSIKNTEFEFDEDGEEGEWYRFTLSVNKTYQKKINDLKTIEVICYISRPETQLRCIDRYFDTKDSLVLVVGCLQNEDNSNNDNMVIYAVSLTFLKTRTRLGFDK
ncbi:MAG: hypothetical protein Q8837_02250 [Sweet potato little leaf phytoplasma]|nr:hypothetical protein [Sweet potato little leaf phytoplasma]